MSLMFKDFARGAKKEANASELKALSDKVKLEIEKAFFKGLGKAGHDQGAHGGDRGGRASGCC
eukprot:3830097-Prymnesium_polylepis.1